MQWVQYALRVSSCAIYESLLFMSGLELALTGIYIRSSSLTSKILTLI